MPLHPWNWMVRGREHLIGPQGAPRWVELVALHKQFDVAAERDT